MPVMLPSHETVGLLLSQESQLSKRRDLCLQAYKILLKVGFLPSQIVIILDGLGFLPSSKHHELQDA